MTPVMNPKQTCRESVKNNQNQASYANCSTTKSESFEIALAAASLCIVGTETSPSPRAA